MIANNFVEAIGLLQGFTAQKCADGELTDAELEQMRGELECLIDAINYVLELRKEALQSASDGGWKPKEV